VGGYSLDVEHARYNMVEQQIRTWQVHDADILDTLSSVRREDFVPPAWRNLAFSDLEIPLTIDGVATGESMLSPKLEARLLQSALPQRPDPALNPVPGPVLDSVLDSVLEIGTGSGFMAALLARFARTVISCELHADLAGFARANLERARVANVSVKHCNGLMAAAADTFDLIVLSGSVQFVPETLLQRLNLHGRLIGIVGEYPLMSAERITRTGEREFSSEKLFETAAPALHEFPQRDRFRL